MNMDRCGLNCAPCCRTSTTSAQFGSWPIFSAFTRSFAPANLCLAAYSDQCVPYQLPTVFDKTELTRRGGIQPTRNEGYDDAFFGGAAFQEHCVGFLRVPPRSKRRYLVGLPWRPSMQTVAE